MSESCWYNVKFLRNVNKSQPVVLKNVKQQYIIEIHHDSSKPCLCSFPINAVKKIRQIRLLFKGLETRKRISSFRRKQRSRSLPVLISTMQPALEAHDGQCWFWKDFGKTALSIATQEWLISTSLTRSTLLTSSRSRRTSF